MAKRGKMSRREQARISKDLGTEYHISVNALLKKLYRIVNDKKLPQSVKDAAQREIDKFELSKFWGA